MSMLAYPQLHQFPLRKRRSFRTVINTAADGRTVRYADPAAEATEWQLQYSGLSDEEIATLQGFFTTVEGTLLSFTFLDPTANLLAWSDKLDEPVWQKDPLLAATAAEGFWHLQNTGGGPQKISQTLEAPAGYLCCFSTYVRSALPSAVTLCVGSERSERVITAAWSRIVFAAAGEPVFALELAAGGAVDVFGLQVEAQRTASAYKPATTGGVYQEARLRDDDFEFTTTDLNCHSCTVNIINVNHL